MARLRLLCFPYAGSGPSAYLGWVRLLPPSVELRMVAPPGCELRENEPFETDLSRYLDAVVKAITEEPPIPLALFGHSLGALLAYEVALRLVERRRPPVHLFLSAKESADVPLLFPDLHLRDDAGLLEGLRILNGGLPEELEQDPKVLAPVLQRLRADWTLMSQITAREVPPLPVPVSVLWSPDDPSTIERELRKWDARVVGAVRYEAFTGGHLFLNKQAAAVVRCVCEHLGPSV